MKLSRLHEAFIEKANRPMTFGSLPVKPSPSDKPIIAVERWHESGGALTKRYAFRRREDRADFVVRLMAYEDSNGHCAEIVIREGVVELNVSTNGLDRPTEVDREYARYADLLFRELVYSERHGDED